QEAIQKAQDIALDNSNQQIEPAHLFQALLMEKEGIVSSILMKVGVNRDLMESRVEELIKSYPKVSGAGAGSITISRELADDLDKATKEADKLNDEYVSVEHLLLGMTDNKRSKLGELLNSSGITKDNILKILKEVRLNSSHVKISYA